MQDSKLSQREGGRSWARDVAMRTGIVAVSVVLFVRHAWRRSVVVMLGMRRE